MNVSPFLGRVRDDSYAHFREDVLSVAREVVEREGALPACLLFVGDAQNVHLPLRTAADFEKVDDPPRGTRFIASLGSTPDGSWLRVALVQCDRQLAEALTFRIDGGRVATFACGVRRRPKKR